MDSEGRSKATGMKEDHPGYNYSHPVRSIGQGSGLGHASLAIKWAEQDPSIDAAILDDIAELTAGGAGAGAGGRSTVLDLSKNVEASSKWRKGVPAPTLYRKEREEPNPPARSATTGLHLDYGDPDYHAQVKGGAGNAPFTRRGDTDAFKGRPSMASQVGRGDTELSKHEHQALRDALGEEDYSHAVGSHAGNQLSIDVAAAEASTVRNQRGGSMPGVTGRGKAGKGKGKGKAGTRPGKECWCWCWCWCWSWWCRCWCWAALKGRGKEHVASICPAQGRQGRWVLVQAVPMVLRMCHPHGHRHRHRHRHSHSTGKKDQPQSGREGKGEGKGKDKDRGRAGVTLARRREIRRHLPPAPPPPQAAAAVAARLLRSALRLPPRHRHRHRHEAQAQGQAQAQARVRL